MSQAFSLSTAEAAAAVLSPMEASQLTSFARACKAAQSAVLLYPEGHTAIAAALARLVELTAPDRLTALRAATRAHETRRYDGVAAGSRR